MSTSRIQLLFINPARIVFLKFCQELTVEEVKEKSENLEFKS